jgi:ATP-binding cassette, subfamily A (ABC1), member 3
MVLTTHFLDECEVLADRIAILSRGHLKCQGTSAALLSQHGGGYRVHLARRDNPPRLGNFPMAFHQDQIVYTTPDSASAAHLISQLNDSGEQNISLTGPTVEDVFLNVSDEHIAIEEGGDTGGSSSAERARKRYDDVDAIGAQLSHAQTSSFLSQVLALMKKRYNILLRNWWPYFFILGLPIAITPALNRFLKSYEASNCVNLLADPHTPTQLRFSFDYLNRIDPWRSSPIAIAVGPPSVNSSLLHVLANFPVGNGYDLSLYHSQVTLQNTFDDFQSFVQTNFINVTPGALWMGDSITPPTYAYDADFGMYSAMLMQNIWSQVRSGVEISASFEYLSSLISVSTVSLQLVSGRGLTSGTSPALQTVSDTRLYVFAPRLYSIALTSLSTFQ